MAKTGDQKLTIEIADEGPGLPVYFINQFRVSTAKGVVQLHLVANLSGQNVTSVLLIVPATAVHANRDTVAQYYEDALASATQVTIGREADSFTAGAPTVHFGNLLDFARHGDIAQIRLSFFSIRKLVEIEAGNKVRGWPVCSINMTMDVQLGIINRVYFG